MLNKISSITAEKNIDIIVCRFHYNNLIEHFNELGIEYLETPDNTVIRVIISINQNDFNLFRLSYPDIEFFLLPSGYYNAYA